MTTKPPYHIAIVDDHALFAKSLEKLINSFEDFDVIFHAINGFDLQNKLKERELLPDVILLDINMPVMNGLETMEWLSNHHSKIKVLALTMEDEESLMIKMIRSGARGYLLKDIYPDALKAAILEVIEKGFYYTEEVNIALMNALHKKETPDADLKLKKKEITFIKLASTEMTYKEIAEEMNLSPKTIDGYRQELFNKLHLKNRVGLVLYAMKNNLID
ncbi:MAG: response regulator transcription factor [Flavobacteriaceae bacterium]